MCIDSQTNIYIITYLLQNTYNNIGFDKAIHSYINIRKTSYVSQTVKYDFLWQIWFLRNKDLYFSFSILCPLIWYTYQHVIF